MNRLILIAVILLTLMSSCSTMAQSPLSTEVTATVLSVKQGTFPHVEIRLLVKSSSDQSVLKLPSAEIAARNYFYLANNKVDLSDIRNWGAIAGFFLLQGDEIHAKLFSGASTSRQPLTWYVFDIRRINTGPVKCPEGKIHGNLSISLSTDKPVYKPGEPVNLILTVRNIGSTHEILQFRSGQHFDFVVTGNGSKVWSWSDGRVFTMATTSMDIAPEAVVEFKAQWPQSNRERKQVSSGYYDIVGTLGTSRDPLCESEPMRVTIQP